ncbi:hypothetical protein DFH06DRAFT_1127574 [Mycena polygramma]|nr:hypothetical protein DFH06DRAFT_1127574 [Mycena polygramma]
MSRSVPLYTMIRPPLVYVSSSAYTQSAPDLQPRRVKTQGIPEDVDFINTATTLVNTQHEQFLSEPVSFLQFFHEKESLYHSPVRPRHRSLVSPVGTMECVPCPQPISSSIKNNDVRSTYQSTPPLSPAIADAHPDGHGYNYLRPPLITRLTLEERNAKDLETEHAYVGFEEDPTSVFHPYPFTRSVKAIIRDVNDEYFGVYRQPYELLEPGMRVVCFGDMVGVWFTTRDVQKHDGYVMWKWVNHDTRYCTVVHVPNRFVRPPTWMERVKRTIKKLRRMATSTFEIE